jgi:hypothetical protein
VDTGGKIIDLAAFRQGEAQEISLVDLLEQAEALVILQEAVLHQSALKGSQREADDQVSTVANSLHHLHRHLKLIKRLIVQP